MFTPVNVGNYINDPKADDIRTAFIKINAGFSGIPFNIPPAVITGSGVLTASDTLAGADATSGPISLTFPPASSVISTPFFIVKTDASSNPIVLLTQGSDKIITASSYRLFNQGDSGIFISFGSVFWVF